MHEPGGAAQNPFTQFEEQQSTLVVHPPLVATHAVLQTCVIGSHVPWQQSASAVQVAPSLRHVPAPIAHRGGLTVSSQMPEQHPSCGPLLHVSPLGRHVVFAGSSAHLLSEPQMFEQHSALLVQSSPSTLHSAPPHVPPLQSSAQQSSAFVHAVPSATQKFVHCVTPV